MSVIKIFKSSKVSAAHFERRDRNAHLNRQTLDGTNSISRLVELSTKNLVLNTEHDWIDCTEKDGGQDGTVTKQQANIILVCKQTSKAFIKSASR